MPITMKSITFAVAFLAMANASKSGFMAHSQMGAAARHLSAAAPSPAEAAVPVAQEEAATAASPAAETPATSGLDLGYSKKGYSEEWGTEWANGDYPHWKEIIPEAAPFEDRQSDGKISKPYR